ncbi:MAG: transporter substrate-binding domain-containing protein [Succinivibrio sp.]|nr:transporter substrate-binding domain-containing protein [Succinivibrio sp.]
MRLRSAQLKSSLLRWGRWGALLGALLGAGSAAAFSVDAVSYHIGVESESPPYHFRDQNAAQSGFTIELLEAVGRIYHCRMIFEEGPVERLLNRTRRGELDALVGGRVLDSAQQKLFLRSDPYMQAWLGLLLPEAEAEGFEPYRELRGQRLCVQSDSPGEYFARKIPSATILRFESIAQALNAFKDADCAALIGDYRLLEYKLKHGYRHGWLWPQQLEQVSLNVIISPGQRGLRQIINRGIRQLRHSGEYRRIFYRWFKDDFNVTRPDNEDNYEDN